jgi:hypothetical protein
MKLEEIQAEFLKDAELINETVDIEITVRKKTLLQCKYQNLYTAERKTHITLKKLYEKLYYEKYDLLTNGYTSREELNKDSFLPERQLTTKAAELCLNAHPQLTDLAIAVEEAADKVDYLKACMKSMDNITWDMRTIIEHRKTRNG